MSVNAETKLQLYIFPFGRVTELNVHYNTGIPIQCMVRDRANVKIYKNFNNPLDLFHTGL